VDVFFEIASFIITGENSLCSGWNSFGSENILEVLSIFGIIIIELLFKCLLHYVNK
jgi:hypothetical protein